MRKEIAEDTHFPANAINRASRWLQGYLFADGSHLIVLNGKNTVAELAEVSKREQQVVVLYNHLLTARTDRELNGWSSSSLDNPTSASAYNNASKKPLLSPHQQCRGTRLHS